NLPRHLRKAPREVVAVAARERRVAAGDGCDGSIAVPLDLEDPACAARDLLGQRRQHRDVRADATPRGGRVVVALSNDQPVLLVTAEARGNERPGPVEPLALQPNGETAVLLLVQQLVRTSIPDLDRPRAVLPLRDLALEGRVVERMILDVDGEMLLPGLEGNALRHRPACERA